MNKLVCGVGVNDVDYVVKVSETVGYIDGKQKHRLVWMCPFYLKWRDMLKRCYSTKLHDRQPTYIDCTVVEEWKTFSVFRAWMQQQDWEGNQLDKDLLFPGNKEYGPNACVFVSRVVNSFMTERDADRGEYPIGVSWHKSNNKFQARCNNPFTKKLEFLGYFTCPYEAHKVWLKRKQELAILLAAEQTDARIAEALISRYTNYGGENHG